MNYTWDQIGDNTGLLTQYGSELTRTVKITEFGALTGYAKVVDAINGLLTELGTSQIIGTAHPYLSTAYLRTVTADTIDSDCIQLTLRYSEFLSSDTVVEFGGGVNQIETNKDVDDNLIGVKYYYPSDYPHSLPENLPTDRIVEKTVTVMKNIPSTTMVIRKSVAWPNGFLDIMTLKDTYEGALNDLGWTIGGLAIPVLQARHWMCTGISGVSNNGGITYEMTYAFEKRSGGVINAMLNPTGSGWYADIPYRDPNTGEPPDDILAYASNVAGTTPWGLKTNVPLYKVVQFNGLFL